MLKGALLLLLSLSLVPANYESTHHHGKQRRVIDHASSKHRRHPRKTRQTSHYQSSQYTPPPLEDEAHPKYGFAGVCELEVAKFYCHLIPYDMFCTQHLQGCLELKSECQDFETNDCSTGHKCCSCAFNDCPLEPEGCELIARKCHAEEDIANVNFNSFFEISKSQGRVARGKMPIKINIKPSGISLAAAVTGAIS
jgi:hypothetical protein